MRLLPRLILVALMLAGMVFLFKHVKKIEERQEAAAAVDLTDADASDASELSTVAKAEKVLPYYIALLGIGCVVAVVTCVTLLPLVGEMMGRFIFTPNERIERSPHADALAKLAAGDLEGAAEEYQDVAREHPQDTHAISEVVRIYCEKLGTPQPAADFLVEMLSVEGRSQTEWAFLSQRLVDVCWGFQRDAEYARAILIKIAEEMPDTREAANARHRLQEIERTMNEEAYLSHAPVPHPPQQ